MTSSHIRVARRLLAGLGHPRGRPAARQAAQAQQPASPHSLLPPAGNFPYLVGHATGVQIYQCSATPTGFAWTFVAPRANLTDNRGRVIITPLRRTDVAGQRRQQGRRHAREQPDRVAHGDRVAAAVDHRNARAPSGGGLLADATFVQRLFTVGGLAPAASTCNTTTAGAKAEVPYTAEYVFWKAIPRPRG